MSFSWLLSAAIGMWLAGLSELRGLLLGVSVRVLQFRSWERLGALAVDFSAAWSLFS